jgi:imidazolonepropionase-like amidohydrolase
VRCVLSADWVLPIEGPPIADGAVAIEDGRIAAVGRRDELGATAHYADAVIVPGFVNAHSHIEYAVYAGFGDSLTDFAEWIRLHTERKRRIGWEHVTPFLAFPPDVRRVDDTTNTIEALHRQIRNTIKTRGHFPTEEAARKLIYLAINNAQKSWKQTYHWSAALLSFKIHFGDRLP